MASLLVLVRTRMELDKQRNKLFSWIDKKSKALDDLAKTKAAKLGYEDYRIFRDLSGISSGTFFGDKDTFTKLSGDRRSI